MSTMMNLTIRRLRSSLSWRKPRTKLILFIAIAIVFVTYLLFVSLLESLQEPGGREFGLGQPHHQGTGWRLDSAANSSGGLGPLDIPRVAEYCNIPTGISVGDEGEAPEGYKLVSAYVVIRHGDRTPMATFFDVKRPAPREGCVMDAELLQTIPEFSNFLSDMDEQRNQQTAGSEFAKWALYPDHKECASSQLTGTGALQHLFNGMALKEKYVKKWNLFGDVFSPGSQLDLRSTQISRTYQSAMAFLYAFLPRFQLEELEVKVSRNSLFCSGAQVPESCCSGLMKMKLEVDRDRGKLGKSNPLHAPVMEAFAHTFGVKVGHLPGPTALVDFLHGHACHQLSLPCGAESGRCVDASMMERLWGLVDSDARSFTVHPKSDRFNRLQVHSLLAKIANSMARVASGKDKVKFSLFSGHDVTLSPLLQALGVHDGKWPRYASRLVFELYEKAHSGGSHYLRVLYNGKDITSHVRFCSGKTVDGLCHLQYFEDFVERDNLKVIGVSDKQRLAKFCKSYS